MTDQLPATPMADFAKRAAEKRQPQTHMDGGFLGFNGKTGNWTFGQEETDVTDLEVHVLSDSMQHGFIQWGTKPPTKVFTSVAQDIPRQPAEVDGVDQDGRECTFVAAVARQVVGKFAKGKLGQFIFNTSSMGGVERLDKLFDDILLKSRTDEYCYPMVELSSDYYKRSTGRVYKPVFKIVAWYNANAEIQTLDKRIAAQPDRADDEPETEEPAPTRRRRRVAS